MGRRRHKEGIDEILGVTALNGVAWVGISDSPQHVGWGSGRANHATTCHLDVAIVCIASECAYSKEPASMRNFHVLAGRITFEISKIAEMQFFCRLDNGPTVAKG